MRKHKQFVFKGRDGKIETKLIVMPQKVRRVNFVY